MPRAPSNASFLLFEGEKSGRLLPRHGERVLLHMVRWWLVLEALRSVLPSSVALGKLSNLSQLQFPHPQHWGLDYYVEGLL